MIFSNLITRGRSSEALILLQPHLGLENSFNGELTPDDSFVRVEPCKPFHNDSLVEVIAVVYFHECKNTAALLRRKDFHSQGARTTRDDMSLPFALGRGP